MCTRDFTCHPIPSDMPGLHARLVVMALEQRKRQTCRFLITAGNNFRPLSDTRGDGTWYLGIDAPGCVIR
jgi:hypothetical protein